MKKLFCFLLAFVCILAIPLAAFADGDPNIDGGGGGVGDGDTDNNTYWNIGNDGIRVTVIRESTKIPATTPVDFSNIDTNNIEWHFGNRCKLQYGSLKLSGNKYKSIKLAASIPRIVSSGGSSNIAAVKNYFRDTNVLKDISQQTGFSYDTLINGNYVLLLEPILYFRLDGVRHAATATEVALYDQVLNGQLKSKLGLATHQNLPLAMYLEVPQLGFPAYTGSSSGIKSNATIIGQLGLGIVNFKEQEEKPDTPSGEFTDYEYHTNTNVITSVYVHGGSSGVSPDDNGKVTFTVNGSSYTKSYVAPPDESQLVWFKWRTPSTPQTVSMSVSVSGGGWVSDTNLTAKISELEEITPPDPQPRDTKPTGFAVKDPPVQPQKKTLNWGYWIPEWEPKWEWEEDWDWVDISYTDSEGKIVEDGYWVDNGEWVDNGKWIYFWEAYNASIGIDMITKPDEQVKTAYTGNYGKVYMPSGYGVNIEIRPSYGGSYGSQIVPAQNAVATFPEFGYKTYNRVMDLSPDHVFRLKENIYSQLLHRVHFTPLWYPDFEIYQPQAVVMDCWTPAGELRVSGEYDKLYIQGNVYDDWRWVPYKVEKID